jgi:hexosaminidase
MFMEEFIAHKAMAKDMTLNTKAHQNYNAGLPHILADGIRGNENFRSGAWGGWRSEPFDVTIDMEGSEPYSSVTLGALIIKYDDIFNPSDITVYTSEDGENFSEVGKAVFETEGKNDPNGLKEYTVSFPETSARYVKVRAKSFSQLPQWHYDYGKVPSLLIDEVIVK